MAEQFKALTRNPEVPNSSPLLAGHAGVNSLLASLPASWDFQPLYFFVCIVALKSPLQGVVIRSGVHY